MYFLQTVDPDKVKYMLQVTALKKRQEKLELKLVNIFICT